MGYFLSLKLHVHFTTRHQIFSEIVNNSEMVEGKLTLPLDYENGEYVFSDVSELIDVMYGKLFSHISQMNDTASEENEKEEGGDKK